MNLKAVKDSRVKDSQEQTLLGLIKSLEEKGIQPRAIIGEDEDEDTFYTVDEVEVLPNGEYSLDVEVDEDVKKEIEELRHRYHNVYVVDNEDNWFLNICLKDGKLVSYDELKEDPEAKLFS